MSILWRAIGAFLALPGIVGFLLPITIALAAHCPARHLPVSIAIIGLGTLLLLSCARELYVTGRGTLAVWSPPQRLVTSGPYRLSRNPMYIAVLTILFGWWLLWGSRTLILYALGCAAAFYLHVVLAEEPWVARTFGEEWRGYRDRVPRWLI